MALRRCDSNLHFYNPEQYFQCPYCRGVAGAVGPTRGFRADDYAALQQHPHAPVRGPAPGPGHAHAGPGHAGSGYAGHGHAGQGAPAPVAPARSPAAAPPAPAPAAAPAAPPAAPGAAPQASAGTSFGATIGVAQKVLGFEPVVGWLVCTSGPSRGKDYRVPDGASVVGRGPSAHVRIEGDPTVSSDQLTLLFDRRTSKFFVFPGRARNPTYLNGELLLSERPLQARDRLEMGETHLTFVPFCGPDFSWAYEVSKTQP